MLSDVELGARFDMDMNARANGKVGWVYVSVCVCVCSDHVCGYMYVPVDQQP